MDLRDVRLVHEQPVADNAPGASRSAQASISGCNPSPTCDSPAHEVQGPKPLSKQKKKQSGGADPRNPNRQSSVGRSPPESLWVLPYFCDAVLLLRFSVGIVCVFVLWWFSCFLLPFFWQRQGYLAATLWHIPMSISHLSR